MSVYRTGELLPNVAAGICCPLCGAFASNLIHKSRVNHRGETFDLTKCDLSHPPVLLSFPWESEEEYINWYKDANAYHTEEQAKEGQESYYSLGRHVALKKAAEIRWGTLSHLIRQPGFRGYFSLLDIGAGSGDWVDHLIGYYGLDAHGYEPNKALSGIIQNRQRIHEGTWVDIPLTRQWDCVTMLDVFEHLTRPADCLRRCYELTKPGGYTVIETPELESFNHIAAGWDWKHIRPRQHICLYSHAALVFMAHLVGFQTVFTLRPLNGSLGKMTVGFYKPEVTP